MKTSVAIVQDVLAVLVMLGVLLQTPKATGLGGAIGGGSDGAGGYRRRRGIEATLFRGTVVLAILFVVTAVLATAGSGVVGTGG